MFSSLLRASWPRSPWKRDLRISMDKLKKSNKGKFNIWEFVHKCIQIDIVQVLTLKENCDKFMTVMLPLKSQYEICATSPLIWCDLKVFDKEWRPEMQNSWKREVKTYCSKFYSCNSKSCTHFVHAVIYFIHEAKARKPIHCPVQIWDSSLKSTFI